MSESLHVVFGTGPAGAWISRVLIGRGERVRAVNRSGVRPALVPDGVEVVAADVSDPAAAVSAAKGAAVVYQALNPPYHQWAELFPGLQAGALAAAKAAGARYVSMDNLYMYGLVLGSITEDSPVAPCSKKGEVRARMAADVLAAHEAGEIRAAILRSSDYYGPGVTLSALGARTFEPMLAGKGGEAIGDADLPHSFAYIEDVAAGAVALGTDDHALGRVWFTAHAPASSPREVILEGCRIAGVTERVNVVSPLMMRMVGLFSAPVRETNEMMYEFTNPFVVDSTASERELGLTPTPISEGLGRTIEWYRGRETT
jgi:nucleoside-diphosphate-sugar epimerase